jgi:hypothetical protein
VNCRIVAALVVALLAVSCSPDEPPEPQVTALKPTKKISTHFVLHLECPSRRAPAQAFVSAHGCPGQVVLPSDRPKTAAIVSQLRQEKPSWLRYIQAVEVVEYSPLQPLEVVEFSPLQPESERLHQAQVQTGIFVNEAGRDLGAEICLAILKEELDWVSIYGVFEDSQYRARHIRIPVLAGCHP